MTGDEPETEVMLRMEEDVGDKGGAKNRQSLVKGLWVDM